MKHKNNIYKISNVKFIVPTLQTAQIIFEQGFGLKPTYEDEDDFRAYALNDETSISVSIEPEVSRYDWPWNRLSIWTTRSNLLASYKRLKKLYKSVKLNIRKSKDGKRKKYSLKITVGLNAGIYIYDLSTKDDETFYYPTKISRHYYEPQEIFVPLPGDLYKKYKTQNKITNDNLEIDEILLLFNTILDDYFKEKITLAEFGGICDELNRQFNTPKNVRIFAGEVHVHPEWTDITIGPSWGVELFFADENKNERRYKDVLERLTKYYKKTIN